MYRTSILAAVFSVACLSGASAAMLNFHATMDGKAEVPPTTSTGSGDMLGTLDTSSKQFSYTVTFFGLSGPAAAAHFHGPAAPGANAGVALPVGGANPTSPITGSAALTDAQMADLQAGKWYVNVHTAANKGGEIRGQVMPTGGPGPAARRPMKQTN
jgi:CHRD domain